MLTVDAVELRNQVLIHHYTVTANKNKCAYDKYISRLKDIEKPAVGIGRVDGDRRARRRDEQLAEAAHQDVIRARAAGDRDKVRSGLGQRCQGRGNGGECSWCSS